MRSKIHQAPDIEGLRAYIRVGDREAPVRFAGRTREIEEILALAGCARHGKVGLTHVISAAPGAGKTALLREVATRCTTQGVARPVYLPATSFARPKDVIRRIVEAVDPEAATKRRKTLPADFDGAFELLADKKTPIVLLVDEAQAWEGDLPSGRSGLLMDAHLNPTRLPLMIVAAGLGDAPEAVASRGASNLKTEQAPLILGALSEVEMREVCAAFFDHFGVLGSPGRKVEWAEALIAGTDGWPRHLTNALRGAAEQLAETGGDLEKAPLEEALQSARRFRQQYYADQMRPFQGMPRLLSAVFAAMPEGGGSRAALRKAIVRAYDVFPRLEHRMPRAEVFGNLLHKGLLQNRGDGWCDCPILSFRTYVEDFCASHGCPVAGPDSIVEPEADDPGTPEPG